MFTIFSELLSDAAQGIGAIFLSIGLMLSGTPASTETSAHIEATSTATIEQRDINEEGKSERSISNQTQKTTNVTETKTPVVISQSNNTSLEITNISINTDNEGTTAFFTWKSTIPTRSRIELDGDTYDSENGLSLEHSVSIAGLTEGESYDYVITARTQDDPQLEDDIHGTYIPLEESHTHTAFLRGARNDDCQEITVIDSSSKTAANISLVISTHIVTDSGGIISSGSKTYTSDKSGIIEICDLPSGNSVIKYKIYSKQTGTITL